MSEQNEHSKQQDQKATIDVIYQSIHAKIEGALGNYAEAPMIDQKSSEFGLVMNAPYSKLPATVTAAFDEDYVPSMLATIRGFQTLAKSTRGDARLSAAGQDAKIAEHRKNGETTLREIHDRHLSLGKKMLAGVGFNIPAKIALHNDPSMKTPSEISEARASNADTFHRLWLVRTDTSNGSDEAERMTKLLDIAYAAAVNPAVGRPILAAIDSDPLLDVEHGLIPSETMRSLRTLYAASRNREAYAQWSAISNLIGDVQFNLKKALTAIGIDQRQIPAVAA